MTNVNNMAKNWTKVYKKYRGLWVAFAQDEETVVSSAKTAKEAWLKAQERGVGAPILAKVPTAVIPCVCGG